MSASAKRTYILEPGIAEGGRWDVEPARERLGDTLSDLIAVLVQCGGAFEVLADRIKLGELPADRKPHEACRGTGVAKGKGDGGEDLQCAGCEGRGWNPGAPEPLGETVGFIVRYRPIGRLEEQPQTIRALVAAGVIELEDPEEG